jgi:hypothetical protein
VTIVKALAGGTWVVLGVLAAGSAIDAQGPDWTVYLRRAGAIRIGMSVRQVRTALDDPRARLRGSGPGSADECAYLASAKLPEGLRVMFERGRAVRIDVSVPGILTASGIGVGATEDEVKRAYGPRIQVEPHKYEPAGHYLRYVAVDEADRPFGLVAETDGQRVTSFRAGTVAAISLVEGCG